MGASIAANKVPGVRAALIADVFSAQQGVEDDDMNVFCLGGKGDRIGARFGTDRDCSRRSPQRCRATQAQPGRGAGIGEPERCAMKGSLETSRSIREDAPQRGA